MCILILQLGCKDNFFLNKEQHLFAMFEEFELTLFEITRNSGLIYLKIVNMKLILPCILLVFSNFLVSQKDLNLEDAVLQQYRKYAPDRITSFQWLPNSTKYSYLNKDRGTLLNVRCKLKRS